ncbi:MAG: hypothetical protein ACKVWV_09255 [Planctomycetota bacterium]
MLTLGVLDRALLELGALAAIACGALVVPRAPAHVLTSVLRWLGRQRARRTRAILACALLAAVASAAVAWLVHWPAPRVHDEFSYLLQADTFAHGRLANPAHPLWQHFESFHVVTHPYYVSKYPPGHGLVLAAGTAIGGHPLVGVWIEAALFIGALAWMLVGWLPFRWALLGTLVVIARFGVASYWTQSYWGGSLAACGGALVYGALPRLLARHSARDAWLFGAGLFVLACTRPFEGLIASAPACVILARERWRSASAGGYARELRRAAPLAASIAAIAAWTIAYDRATTGDPWTMPYWLHDRLYAVAPPFLWLPLAAEPVYQHALIREYWTGWALEPYRACFTSRGFFAVNLEKLAELWKFYAGPLWSAPLLALPAVASTPLARVALYVCVAFVVAILGSTYTLAHYAAPVLGLLTVLTTLCVREIARVRVRGRPYGAAAVCGLLAATVAALAFQIRGRVPAPGAWEEARARVQSELSATAEPDLVIVRYGTGHSAHDEWVYNGADIDAAPVVWARDMGAAKNRALLDYFEGRRVWTCEVAGDGTPTLSAHAR